MSSACRGLLCVLVFVVLPIATSAQQRAVLVSDAPIYLLPDVYRQPLLVAGSGGTADVLAREGVWYRISFEDSRRQLRVGYIQAKYVRLLEAAPAAPQQPERRAAAPTSPGAAPTPTIARNVAPATVRKEAEAKPKGPVRLAVRIIDRSYSESSYRYVSPARATTTASSSANCSGTAMSLTPEITSLNAYCYGSGTATTTIRPSTVHGYDVAGATYTLLLSDGRRVVVNCDSKYALRGDYINRRSCRMPLVDDIHAEFKGDDAKLFWSISIDGSESQSETYKVLGILGATD
jgi:hypothetical protein